MLFVSCSRVGGIFKLLGEWGWEITVQDKMQCYLICTWTWGLKKVSRSMSSRSCNWKRREKEKETKKERKVECNKPVTMNWEIFRSCVESILSGCTGFGQEQDRVESRSRPSEKSKHSRARSCLTVNSQRWLFTELCASGINNKESSAFFRRYDQYISKLSPGIRILSLRNLQNYQNWLHSAGCMHILCDSTLC